MPGAARDVVSEAPARSEFPFAILERPASGEFAYESWVNTAMGELEE